MPKKLSDQKINDIEAGIDDLNYTGDDVQLLIDELRRRRQEAVQIAALLFEQPDGQGFRQVEAEIRRLRADQAKALSYLDTIILAYHAPGIMALSNSCRAAAEWRGIQEPEA